MIHFVKDGLRITEEDWSGANPRPDANPDYSSVSITFKHGQTIHISEGFLRHALYLIEFQRNLNLKLQPSQLERCLVMHFNEIVS